MRSWFKVVECIHLLMCVAASLPPLQSMLASLPLCLRLAASQSLVIPLLCWILLNTSWCFSPAGLRGDWDDKHCPRMCDRDRERRMDPATAGKCPRVTWAGGEAASSTGRSVLHSHVGKSTGSGIRRTCAETLIHPFLGDPGMWEMQRLWWEGLAQAQRVADASERQNSGPVLTVNASSWHS